MIRPNVRAIPWLVAFTGLAIPLVSSGFVLWLTIELANPGLAEARS